MFESIDEALARLRAQRYLLSRELATSVFLACKLGKPLLIEGEPGVGKSELARALADALGTELVRLQCHARITDAEGAFEWNRAKQLLAMLRTARESEAVRHEAVFAEENLIRGPLLEALRFDGAMPPVLLIDRIDLADEAFEASLARYLEEFSVTVPEMGTIRARRAPIVVITSNGARQLDEGLRRRCVFVHVGYPPFEAEVDLVLANVPGIGRPLAGQVCNVVARLRAERAGRRPGIGEALDWARALVALRVIKIDVRSMDQTLGCLFKSAEDIERVRQHGLARLLAPAFDRAG
jgi:MoxR-like ATPase